jgi:ABC-type microcin C transport system permease subunit YejB
MSREMRLGSNYSCAPNSNSIQRNGNTSNCSNNDGWAIAFDSQYRGRDSVDINVECNLTYVYFFDKSVNRLKKMQSRYCDDNISDSNKYFEVIASIIA